MSWCMVPRLSASGWFEVDGKRTSFASRPAYHDHNWGRFTWGGDFCWEWGCALPEDAGSPWSVVFARMTDRARQRTSATSVFLLERDRYLRYFRNGEVRFESEGRLHPRPAGRIPPAAALLLPDEDRDVARVLRFEARRGSDELRGEVAGRSRGQVLVPSESNAHALVRINEVSTRVTVEGTCCGKPVRLAGPGLLEVVRG